MREHLLGYLMGALDASQQREVESAIQDDPRLRQELESLNQALDPLRTELDSYEPPLGLANRTLDVIGSVAGWPDEPRAEDVDQLSPEAVAFQLAFESNHLQEEVAPVPAPLRERNRNSRGRARGAMTPVRENGQDTWNRWDFLDVAVSMALVAAAAMLFFPAIANSRFQARVTACQSNLQSIARALDTYSENNNGRFVSIPVKGNSAISGVYAPTLLDEGYKTDDKSFFCAGDLVDDQGVRRQIPSLAALTRAQPGPELRHLQHIAGGSYGYNLGYMNGDRYTTVRNARRPRFALVADAPREQGGPSMHHEGRGQNVAFEDGHVEFVPGGAEIDFDDIYLSERGLVEAGLGAHDSVIGSSSSRPVIFAMPVSNVQP